MMYVVFGIIIIVALVLDLGLLSKKNTIVSLKSAVKQTLFWVMLALGFLMMIGMTLIAEGFGAHVPKGYIYAAMAFSALIEGLNMLARRARQRAQGTAGTPAAGSVKSGH